MYAAAQSLGISVQTRKRPALLAWRSAASKFISNMARQKPLSGVVDLKITATRTRTQHAN